MKMNTQHKNLLDEAKAMLRDKFITLNAYIRQEERSQINDLKKPEKEEQIQLKISRRKEIMKARAEMTERVNRKTIEKNQ